MNDGFSCVISGIGMLSSLGHDLATSCASARAGLSRTTEFNGYTVFDASVDSLVGLKVHSAFGMTEGFSGIGRLLQLGSRALADPTLELRGGIANAALIVNLPSRAFERKVLAMQAENADLRKATEHALEDIREEMAGIEETFVGRLLQLSGIDGSPRFSKVIFGDEVGFAKAVVEVAEFLRRGTVEFAIVGGIDSLVRTETLKALHEIGLLAVPDNPVGIVPGEMAVFVRLERRDAVRAGSAVLDSISVAEEIEQRLHGRGLAKALAATIGADADAMRHSATISSLSGDPATAHEWGSCQVLMKAETSWTAGKQWYPAEHFGYVGAASAGAALALAVTAFKRKYASSETIIAWLSGAGPDRAAFCVRRVTSEGEA